MNTSFAFSMPEDDHIKQSSLVKIFDETGTVRIFKFISLIILVKLFLK